MGLNNTLLNNEWVNNEIKEKINFSTTTIKYQKQKLGKNPIYYSNKKNKVLGINLTKEVKDLYRENYRTLKKLRKIQTNGSIYCVHGLGESTSLKCAYYPK